MIVLFMLFPVLTILAICLIFKIEHERQENDAKYIKKITDSLLEYEKLKNKKDTKG